jgi:signal transduction histidine kinase
VGLSLWIRPPRRTLTVFLCLILFLGGALGWLGWQWLRQDRALEGQRLQEELELAADQMAATLQQSFADLESYLSFTPSPAARRPPEGILVIQAKKRELDAYPSDCLLYYPVLPNAEEPPAAVFAAGEILEFQRNDPANAIAVFQELARSPDQGVRAGALLRLGRNFRKAGRNEEALQVYAELTRLGGTPVLGLPAELLAHEAAGTVLEAIGKSEELKNEASLLREALWSGRWNLLRPAWEYHREEAQRWLGPIFPTESERNALSLSIAVESLFGQWSAEPESRGRRIQKFEDRPVLISWSATADRLAAVLAGPAYVEAKWTRALTGGRVQGALVDRDGRILIGAFDKNARLAVRTEVSTRLPGTLHATSSDPGADEEGVAGRRRLLYTGFAVLALTLLAGSYFIVRSINREQAVARLQSEFVSAVSHEFRTPLTSLRQLSEMLAKGRVPTEDLRQKSYDLMSGESERLQRLVESLLDFGRLEARAFRYRYAILEPGALVRELVAEFREKAAVQGYRVEMNGDGTYPLIRADREALCLALRNLLDNAVKYSPDTRVIWVETAHEGNRLAIGVRDRGMGIPASEQKDIFKKFVRGAGSREARIPGTGIGLAIARLIVEAHDGEIRLVSEPGKGSTFTVLLPLEKKA